MQSIRRHNVLYAYRWAQAEQQCQERARRLPETPNYTHFPYVAETEYGCTQQIAVYSSLPEPDPFIPPKQNR